MDPETTNKPTTSPSNTGANDLACSMSNVNLDDKHGESDHSPDKRKAEQPTRRLIIYPRQQTLKLSKSPLVKPPEGMPALKDWFGYGFRLICVPCPIADTY